MERVLIQSRREIVDDTPRCDRDDYSSLVNLSWQEVTPATTEECFTVMFFLLLNCRINILCIDIQRNEQEHEKKYDEKLRVY